MPTRKSVRDFDEVSQVKSHISSVYKIRAPLEFKSAKKQLEIKGLESKKQQQTADPNPAVIDQKEIDDIEIFNTCKLHLRHSLFLIDHFLSPLDLNKHAKMKAINNKTMTNGFMRIRNNSTINQHPGVASSPVVMRTSSLDEKKTKNNNLCESNGRYPCSNPIFKALTCSLCKHHFLKIAKSMLRKEIRELYRHPDIAFGALDLKGTGIVNIESFLSSIVCRRVTENSRKNKIKTNMFNSVEFKHADMKVFAECANIFDFQRGGIMNFPVFKKVFFP